MNNVNSVFQDENIQIHIQVKYIAAHISLIKLFAKNINNLSQYILYFQVK